MKELLDKIDGILNDIASADLWGYVKNAVNKLKELLAYLGEDDAVKFVDILTK